MRCSVVISSPDNAANIMPRSEHRFGGAAWQDCFALVQNAASSLAKAAQVKQGALHVVKKRRAREQEAAGAGLAYVQG